MSENALLDSLPIRGKGLQTLARLTQAMRVSPRSPTLTPPERELLAACGLGTPAALRRRLHERALLAAYDGAPSALTEVQVERVPLRSPDEQAPKREHPCAEPALEELWETTMAYEPETLRVRIRFAVGAQERRDDDVDLPAEPPDRRFYAVTVRIHDGRVLLREQGKIKAVPGLASTEYDVTQSFAAQDIR